MSEEAARAEAVARGDVPDHPRAADHREGDHAVRAGPGRVPRRASTPPSRRSRRRSRVCSASRSLAVNTLVQKGKTKRFKGRPGRRSDVKKAFVRLAAGPVDRFHHRPRIRRARDGTQAIQSGHGEPARHGADRPLRAVEGQAGQGADRGQAQHRRAQQPRPHHQPVPRRRAQAVLSRSSISSAASSTCRRRWSGWNTIRTAPRSSRWSSTRTASWPTSWRRSGCGRRPGDRRRSAPTSSRATRCRWRRSRSARSSTTSR